ncbi:YkgJ family cysteine cluster protein [Desulfovibrio sp. Huiquan2017]|uniref:YkgJ family cysteine cluster protein n=1 Tax=Desulfovibrio sp. Huiquan2017 TaxID=2816861 RepID=UPI001A92E309|nr:YkgJ family cysteine cluster protein [Desulfovibrio sp. Huiquan2017]
MAARSRSKPGGKRRPKRAARAGTTGRGQPSGQARDALAARIAEDGMTAFVAVLRPADDAAEVSRTEALHQAVHDAYARLDAMLEELAPDPPLACHQGCIHCCYNQVALTEPEALYLGRHLLETRDARELRDLEARTRALAERLKGKSWQDIGMARHRLPCLFLENGGCSVYPARPLACRGWNSVDADRCLQSNLSGNALTLIENHPVIRQMADAVQSSLLLGANALGLEAGYLLMARATLLLLENGAQQGVPEQTADWLRGSPFFGRKKTW